MYKPLAKRFEELAASQQSRLRSLAREQSEHAFNIVLGILNCDAMDPRVRLKAAEMIMDRAEGKPHQLIEATKQTTETLRKEVVFRIVDVEVDEPKVIEHVNGNGS